MACWSCTLTPILPTLSPPFSSFSSPSSPSLFSQIVDEGLNQPEVILEDDEPEQEEEEEEPKKGESTFMSRSTPFSCFLRLCLTLVAHV